MPRRKINWTVTDDDMIPAYGSDRPPGVRSVDRPHLHVVYQPIVDFRTRQTAAVEALTRCTLAPYRNPAVLFAEAAAAEYAGRLGRMVRELAFDSIDRIPIFINVHPAELAARWLVRPDDPMFFHEARVFLEVTEAAAFEHHDLIRAVLGELKSRGISLVIDDFGAGYSNLDRLADLEPAVVKLDRSLITALHESPRQQILVRHLVALMHDFEAKVVLEGIEEPEELRACVDSGADFGQGYLLARPANPIPTACWPVSL